MKLVDYFKSKSKLITEKTELTNELKLSEQIIIEKQKRIEELTTENDNYKFLLDKDHCKTKIENLENLLNNYRTTKRELREEIKQLKATIEILKQTINNLK